MNINAYAGISVARYVAMQNLDTTEIEKIKQSEIERIEKKEGSLFKRASRVMSRVSFVDEIRYDISLDLTDTFECIERNALETYLLCTCLDSLAGKDDYMDLQNWLKAKDTSTTILGIPERKNLMTKEESKQQVLTSKIFSSVLSKSIELYNKHYGINQNIINTITNLPVYIKKELVSAYTIYKESDPDEEKRWRENRLDDVDDKLKTIFIKYLFHYRRNLYTHESRRFGSFGGVSTVRQALRAGTIELPSASTIRFPFGENNAYIVTCYDGDEAEFLRKVIIACLAHKFNLLHNGWSDAYRKAERGRRLLYTLLYELKNNIQVMQLHLQVLSEPLINKNKNGSPKLDVVIAQSILENNKNEITTRDGYLLHPYLHPYIESALQFNNEIDKTGAATQYHMEDTSPYANNLIMKSKVRLHAKGLGNRCMELLEDYPIWTYSANYIPPQSF